MPEDCFGIPPPVHIGVLSALCHELDVGLFQRSELLKNELD